VRLIGSPKYYRQCRAVTPLCGRHELTRLRTTPGGAYAYLLNRHAAQTLLDCTRRNWLPVDAVLGQVWRTRLDVFCVRPSPVLPDHAVASTIGDERFDKSIRLSGWERAVYPLSRAALKIYESAGKAAMNIMNHRREKGKATAVRPYAGHTSDEAVAWVSTEADSTRASP
jgi:GR25 family glycosyltransferase involved in LPS biosynthesis